MKTLEGDVQRHLLNNYLNLFWEYVVAYIVHAFLLSNIQYLKDLNDIMSNKVEKRIKRIDMKRIKFDYCLKNIPISWRNSYQLHLIDKK